MSSCMYALSRLLMLDLTSGPVVVSTADTEGRYFLLPSGNALTLKVTR